MIWAVVPAKLGNEAKVRLGPILPARDRTRLAQAMLGDVLRALAETDRFAGIAVVSRWSLAAGGVGVMPSGCVMPRAPPARTCPLR